MHSRDHADSEYVLYLTVDRKSAEFIGNKHTRSPIYILKLVQAHVSSGD